MAGGGDQFLKVGDWEKRDSKIRFYKDLGENSSYCIYTDEKGNVESKLKACQEIKSEAQKIADGLCYIHSKRQDESDESVRDAFCHALYYWLGDFAWKSDRVSSGTKFIEVMGDIYKALSEFGVSDNCKNMYKDNSNITKDLFEKRRTVFDFSFDYKNIKEKLQLHNYSCEKEYYEHLEKAHKAFGAVSEDCHGKIDLYCIEFKNIFETKNNNNKKQNPLTLKKGEMQSSEGTTIYKDVQLELKYAPPKTNTAMITTISSIFSIGALGFAASLLYKVITILQEMKEEEQGGTIEMEHLPYLKGHLKEEEQQQEHILHQVITGQIYVIIPR
ncbi:Variable surface protein Vir7-like protein [Plasmodium coatneyi]|uniref:Variable surface protein Vir7-like protein n=1 Tax=Plasmodium coatneyi TaxID=208452 RepID=A0A1B1DYB7_9APIC|nr:Variable surface protein Vir7-like protein [Plasmodium coatneyi]ANQ07811.1 Variable surface protein Vir7-like protein [Plasmodium coatneyi]